MADDSLYAAIIATIAIVGVIGLIFFVFWKSTDSQPFIMTTDFVRDQDGNIIRVTEKYVPAPTK